MDVEPKGDLIPLVIPLALSFITHFGVNGFLVGSTILDSNKWNLYFYFSCAPLINGVKVDLGRKKEVKISQFDLIFLRKIAKSGCLLFGAKIQIQQFNKFKNTSSSRNRWNSRNPKCAKNPINPRNPNSGKNPRKSKESRKSK